MSEAAPLPQKIGKYPVLRALGTGATSRVFLADDPFNAQQVAIKLVQRDPLAGDQARRQMQAAFLNEAALAGKLQHPHIAAIHDAVNDGDQSYLVMEYVGGGTHSGWAARARSKARIVRRPARRDRRWS